MKIFITFLITVIFAILIFTQQPPDNLEIHQLYFDPKLDGLPDPGYSPENPIGVQDISNNMELWEGPSDLSAKFRAGWIGDSLYFFIDVTDDVFDTSEESEIDTWQNDALEFFFDGDNSKIESGYDSVNDIQIRIERDDIGPGHISVYNYVLGTIPSWFDTLSVRYFTVEKPENGYLIEVGFSIDVLRLTGDNNDYFGFDMQIDDADGEYRETMLRWHSNSNDEWHWSHIFGNARMTNARSPETIPDNLTIYQFQSDPVVDCQVDQGYGSPNPIAIFTEGSIPGGWTGVEDLYASFRAGWRNDSLYLYVDVTDDIFDTSDEEHSWLNDAIELFFDGDNSKTQSAYDGVNDIQIRFEADDEETSDIDQSTSIDASGWTWDQESVNYLIQKKANNRGYIFEAALDIDKMNLPANTNTDFGFEIQVNDRENDTRNTMLKWHSNNDHSWHWYHVLGEASFTAEYAEPLEPQAITLNASDISYNNALLNALVHPNGSTVNVSFEYGESIDYGNSITANPAEVSGSDPVQASARVSNLYIGTLYHYRAVISDGDSPIYGDDVSFITSTYPETETLSHMIPFEDKSKGSDYLPSDYRIMGFPGNSNLLIGEQFSGTQDEDWQVYWDDGTENIEDALKAYNGDNIFCCIPGRAFWILNKGDFNIDLPDIPSAPLNDDREATIELHNGWNLICNPFTGSIRWADVRAANQLGNTVPIWSFEGDFASDNPIMQPYMGYYFFNSSNLDSLHVPCQPAISKLSQIHDQIGYQWKVAICLTSGEHTDHSAYLAVKDDAAKGLDNTEFRKPRAVGNILSTYFYRPDWDKSYPTFANDVRPPIRDMEEWYFQVEIPSLQPSTLSFSGVEEIPKNYSVYLVDHPSAVSLDLRQQDCYDFTPYKQSTSFSIIVGKDRLVQEKLKKMLPLNFSLSQNFPNPFNPNTTISFALPVQSHVTLNVYSITGQQVKTLMTRKMDAGIHYVSWDGKDNRGVQVSSGIYIYQMMTSSGKKFSGKMILLK